MLGFFHLIYFFTFFTGITLIEQCNENKTFSSEVFVMDKFCKGLKLGLKIGSAFVPFLG